jgi:hypothetical protein
MSLHDAYERWAPAASPWSAWAKPVLFAVAGPPVMFESPPQPASAAEEWLGKLPADAAVVVELPGAAAVRLGLALAARGYQPVPLFNATTGPRPVIEVDSVVRALISGAAGPALLGTAPEALPAFLLDARRMAPERKPQPGDFDNRWMVFPQDFPSATFLQAHGVGSVVLISASERPADDLAHVLLRWQEAGLSVLHLPASSVEPPRPIVVQRPRGYRAWWYRLLVLMGLRRHGAGGFGAVVPQPSSGHGFA